MAMIRQLGAPHLFITLSAAEVIVLISKILLLCSYIITYVLDEVG